MAIEVTTGTKKGRARPSMNVTPLVDVVLVLLIIFMVITPMMAKQFWLNLPTQPDAQTQQAAPPPAPGDGPVVLSVDRAGVVRINREVVERERLGTKLRRVLAARGERTVFFDAADDARFEDAVAVMDLARGGGAATIAVLTEPIAQRQ